MIKPSKILITFKMTDLILSDSRNNVEVKTGREINNSLEIYKFLRKNVLPKYHKI